TVEPIAPAAPVTRTTLSFSRPMRLCVGEALARTLAGFRGLDLAVAWRLFRFERLEQPLGNLRDLLDRARERRLVRLRGMCEPAQLADELQGRGTDLLLVRRWLE